MQAAWSCSFDGRDFLICKLKRPIVAGWVTQPATIGRNVVVLAMDFRPPRRSTFAVHTSPLGQAARVEEPSDFTAAVARFGIDFSIRRISSAKMPEVAT